MSQLQDMNSKALNDLLACNGLHQDNITILARLEATRVLAEARPDQEEINKINLLPGVTAAVVNEMTLDDILMMRMLKKKSKVFGLPQPDFQVPSDELPACAEFIKTFPVEKFPVLKLFLEQCAQKPYAISSSIHTFCQKQGADSVCALWVEFESFNTLVVAETFPTVRRILSARFAVQAPRQPHDWDRLYTEFRHFAREFHADELRVRPETQFLMKRYLGAGSITSLTQVPESYLAPST